MKKYAYYFSIALIFITYLILRVGWQESIEFGYDQPRLALVIKDFIKDGIYINSQQFALESPWGNFSWGPVLNYFYLPFLYFTSHPVTVSVLVAVFNILSIIVVIIIGSRYFSRTAGIVAGALLATHPWWTIFSRMIYQPTPVPTFVALTILATFLFLEKVKSKALIWVMLLWGVLIQLYLSTFSIIIPSIGVVLLSIKKVNKKHIVVGLALLLMLFLPSIYFYVHFPEKAQAFLKASDNFDTEKVNLIDRIKNVVMHYANIIAGGDFEVQLGTGYPEFEKQNHFLQIFVGIVLGIIISCLAFFTFKTSRKNTPYKLQRILLLLWAIGPLWFLTAVKVPDILPRYIILCVPALVLVIGVSFSETIQLLQHRHLYKIRYAILLIPLGICIGWSITTIRYYSFIVNYKYPDGFLSYYSDIPYSFLESALAWIETDAREKGYKNITISNDKEKPTVSALNHPTEYYVKYVRKEKYTPGSDGYYLVHQSNEEPVNPKSPVHHFGPYIVYEHDKK